MTSERNKITGTITKSEEEFIEAMHNATVGKDEFKALQARCLKELGPVVQKWLRDERDRETDTELIVEAIAPIVLNIFISVATSVSKKGRSTEVVGHMIIYLLRSYGLARQQGIM